MPANAAQTCEAYVGLGSNMGNSEEILANALTIINNEDGLELTAQSSIYRTEPQGYADQEWFCNQVARVSCSQKWTASAFMQFLLKVEKNLGRVRSESLSERNGPRLIDLDLLLFGQEKTADADCTLPHARMFERAFVLIPLREVITTQALAFMGTNHANSDAYIAKCLEKLTYKIEGQKIFQS